MSRSSAAVAPPSVAARRSPAGRSRPTRFYEPAAYCTEESVGWLMKRALGLVAQAAGHRLEPQGITHAQWGPLFMLRRTGAATVAELARGLQTDPGAMTRLLDRLEAKGYCRRERSADDRRVVRVELTADGERAATLVPAALSEVLNEHLAGFSRAEWEQLKALLRRVVANGEALAADHPPRVPTADDDR